MYKIAIIGYGGMGQSHARQVRECGFAELTGIYDADPAACQAAEASAVPVYDSLQRLLSSDADICIVTTPNDSHLPLVLSCLRAGKHVIVEKPMGCTAEEVDAMYQAAKENGRLLSVHHNRRWDVDFMAMKQLIQEGSLGPVLNIESRVHGCRGIPSGWRKDPAKGGGMLFDWGVHLVDQMLLLQEDDEPESVQCTFSHYTEDAVDDGFFLTIQFRSGARGFVEVNTNNFLSLPRFYMTCRNGSALLEDWRQSCKVVECFAWHESDVLPGNPGPGVNKTMAPRDEITTRSYELPRPNVPKYPFLRNFCNAIDGTEPLIVTETQVKNVFAVLSAAFRSADAKGAPVPINCEGVT